MNRVEPNRNIYVGHRYVPLLVGEWDKSIQYEGLSIVTFKGASYTSKKMTPPGIDIENEEYWVLTGNYDSQVEYYREEVMNFKNEINNKVSTDDVLKKIITFRIPTDYPDLQTAFNDVINKITTKDAHINLKIESFYQPRSGIILENIDSRHISITSDLKEVKVSDDFEGHFIRGINSHLPNLRTVIDMNDKGRNGYSCEKNSSGMVDTWCGIKNAGGRGFYVSENSDLYGRASISTGCNDRNVWVTRTSSFEGEIGDFSKNKGGNNAVYISRGSTANLLEADISNAYSTGLAVIRSFVNAENINVNNAGNIGIIVQRGSHLICEYATANNCNSGGMRVEQGSFVSSRGISTSGTVNGYGLYVLSGSYCNAYQGISNDNSIHGVYATDGSNINFGRGTSVNNNNNDIRVISGSFINARDVTTTNEDVTKDIHPKTPNSFSSNGSIFIHDHDNDNDVDFPGLYSHFIDDKSISLINTNPTVRIDYSGSNDTLTTINGGYPGQFIIMYSTSVGRPVTLESGGNINIDTPEEIRGTSSVKQLFFNGVRWSLVN